MERKSSIYLKVAFILLFCILLTMVIETLVTFVSNKNSFIAQLKKQTNDTQSRITKTLSDPLWNFDLKMIDDMLSEEMGNEHIFSIYITDVNGGILTGFKRDKDWKTVKLNPNDMASEIKLKSTNDFVSGNIEKYGLTIGVVTILISDKFLAPSIDMMFYKLTFRTILMSSIILILIYVGLKLIILDPLRKLDETVKKFADNSFESRVMLSSHDEIGQLGRNINKMADSMENYANALLNQLYTDTVTDLPNRNRLLLDLGKAECPVLILLNVDSFQEINDFYGNLVGDFVLKEIALRLANTLENKNTKIYRLVADEFAILINKKLIVDEAEVRDYIIKYIFEEINDRVFIYNNNEINITTTVGVAYETSADNDLALGTTILNNADMALKQAKKQRKHFIVFDEKMQITKQYEHNIKWSLKIKSALKESRILPFFQPIVNNLTGEIEKYECLVRMLDINGDVISPYYFLEVSKKARLYSHITKIMIQKVFKICETIEKEFSINISIIDILNEETNSFIFQMLKDHKEIAHRIVFEILESEGIENYNSIISFIDNVKALGCKVAIDDFGSGYSNFDHILRLNVDYIKIDASMIKNIDKDVNCQIITKTIVTFAKELGLKTVSEFVHSKEVYEKVNELGVDYSQGYYLGEPTDSPDMFAYLGD